MKTALITGSTQGIGLSTAARLVRDGFRVIVHCSRDIEKAERIREEIGGYKAVVCDLSDPAETEKLFEKTGPVDVLILNASVQYKQHWQEITDEAMQRQWQVNVVSTLKLMQAYYPKMKENGYGRIITVGSVNQHRCHPELSFYAATKCAVMRLVGNIAKEVAPFGVTVNNISPGAIDTPRNHAVLCDPDALRQVEASIPVGRVGIPRDCAALLSFLASDESAYITGADLSVDGGMSL